MLKEFKTNLKLKTFIAIFLTPILLLGFFIAPARAEGASYLVISEIQTSGVTADDEFVELYNPTDSPVDIFGWSIQYRGGTASTYQKKNFPPGSAISAHGFFLITGSEYTGAIDYNMSWSQSLSGVGGTIFLVSGNDDLTEEIAGSTIVVDKVAYGTSTKNCLSPETSEFIPTPLANQSIERKANNASTADSLESGLDKDLGNGWDSNNNSADFVLRAVSNPQNSSSSIEPLAENPPAPNLTPTPIPSSSSAASASSIQQNLPVAEAGQDKEAVIGENIDFDGSDSFDPQGKELIFNWDFGDKTGAKGINVSHSYNAIGEYSVILKADNGENISEDLLKIKIIAPEFSDKIILSEILPNPIGADKDGEWAELFNFGDKKVNLRGWILRSAAKTSGKQYVFSGDNFIKAKSFLVIHRSESGLVLTNESGAVSLAWPPDKILSEVSYGAAKEGKSYAYINNSWQWVDTPTPGKENSTKALAAVSSEKGNSVLPFDIVENMNGEKVYYDESEMTSDDLIMQSLATNAIFQSIKKTSIEDYLNKLISEKVDDAISKAKANEAAPQEKILALADNAEGVEIVDINKESACEDFCFGSEKNTSGDQKDVRNNPWFYGNIALSALSLFLVWRYQEVRKRLR